MLSISFSMIAGLLLGAFFFGGLWWTVRRGIGSQRVALWFFGSMLLRTGTVMLGFYLLLGDSWQHMTVGLAGFFIARLVATRLARETAPSAQETDHAP